MFLLDDEFGITVKFVVIVESHPAAFGMREMYVPAVETIVPPGRVVVAPAQIEIFLLDDEFGITVKFVVIVESHPAAFAI